MFFGGLDGKVTSHPTKEPCQNSPSPREPEPTSNRVPLAASWDLTSRRIGKNRAARLSKPAYPPREPCHRYKTLDLAPVVFVKKAAEQNRDGIRYPKDDAHP